MLKDKNGITLIAIIITIIMIIIIAGIAFNTINYFGLLDAAKKSTNEYNEKVKEEEQDVDNWIVPEEDVKFPLNKPGKYNMTANAGRTAIWMGVDLRNLKIPEGASVNIIYKTSDDRINWDEEKHDIGLLKNSQYLRVTVELIPNSKGECPSLESVRVKFKVATELDLFIEVELENTVPVPGEENWYTLNPNLPNNSTGKVTQIIQNPEGTQISNIEIPVISGNQNVIPGLSGGLGNGSVNGSSSDGNYSGSNGNSANTQYYTSNDGINWTPASKPSPENPTNSKYVKVETVITGGDISVGKVTVNGGSAATELDKEWINIKTEYYDFDAMEVGKWVSVEKDEMIYPGTRINYYFTKSNDDINWTPYNVDVTANGDSRYIRIKVEYQKQNNKITNVPILNDIFINYLVPDKNNPGKYIPKVSTQYFEGEALVQQLAKANIPDGIHTLTINDETYNLEIYNFEENVEYLENPILGNNIADKTLLVLKYNKDLTIGKNVVITPQVRKQGLILIVNGVLTNNGKISMTARGATAEGQNVYLWQNINDTYEYIPKLGETGGARRSYSNPSKADSTAVYSGIAGQNGVNRGTGGGGRRRNNCKKNGLLFYSNIRCWQFWYIIFWRHRRRWS